MNAQFVRDIDSNTDSFCMAREELYQTFEDELLWFRRLLDVRFSLYFGGDCEFGSIYDLSSPKHSVLDYITPERYTESIQVKILFFLAILPHTHPSILDCFLIKKKNGQLYTEFGGDHDNNKQGRFHPDCQTAVFLMAGDDPKVRLQVITWLIHLHQSKQPCPISFDPDNEQIPFLQWLINIKPDSLNKFMGLGSQEPVFSSQFPAQRLISKLSWADLLLSPNTQSEVDKIVTWAKDFTAIQNHWDLHKSIKPGYRCLFYGPPGTGKTLTASLMGQSIGAPVYRVDISQVVSKYIGETEKNLAKLFDQAGSQHWILFFDEADALFGSRTTGATANDRHANQEVAYLLQKIEDYPGLVILATNLKDNLDEAFARRFQSCILFPTPNVPLRKQLWQKYLQGNFSEDVDFDDIAKNNEVTGGAIINIVRYAAISAWQDRRELIDSSDLSVAINRERRKSGKAF